MALYSRRSSSETAPPCAAMSAARSFCRFPVIEVRRAIVAYTGERACQFRLLQKFARLIPGAIPEEDPVRFGEARQFFGGGRAVERFRELPGYGKTIASQPYRGLQQFFPRPLAVFLMRIRHAGDGAGHAGCAIARDRIAGWFARCGIDIHIARGGTRGALAEVDKRRAAVGETNEHEAAAPDVARRGMRYGQREGDADRRINGVAAQSSTASPESVACVSRATTMA